MTDTDERRQRYAAAIYARSHAPFQLTDASPGHRHESLRHADAAMAVADAEQQALEAELRRYTEADSADAAAGSYAHRAERAEHRLALAHQARRAKEAQLDDVRRALCDTGLMADDDPYSHADLADVIRHNAAPKADPDNHVYLSTGCLHSDHAYCQGTTGQTGRKKPAVCKSCDAPCICGCHQTATDEPATTP